MQCQNICQIACENTCQVECQNTTPTLWVATILVGMKISRTSYSGWGTGWDTNGTRVLVHVHVLMICWFKLVESSQVLIWITIKLTSIKLPFFRIVVGVSADQGPPSHPELGLLDNIELPHGPAGLLAAPIGISSKWLWSQHWNFVLLYQEN